LNIDISRNRISSLHPDTFRNTSGIRKFIAGSNALASLHPTTFRDSKKLWKLDFSNNKLTYLNPDTFSNTDLRYVDLSNNKISSFHPDIFKNNSHLQELYLSNNTINSVNGNMFRNIPALWKLDVSGNKIAYLDSNAFCNNTRLFHFNISHNEINALDPRIFFNNTHLRTVDLSHNNMTFQNSSPILIAPKLSVLFLGFCNIKHLPIVAFQNLTMLRKLGLNNNYLETLEEDSKKQPLKRYRTAGQPVQLLYDLKELEVLDISNNKLRRLTISLVRGHSKLMWLSISGNPVSCDCELQDLWKWCFERHARTHITSCDTLDTCSWEYVRRLSCGADNHRKSHLTAVTVSICMLAVVLVFVAAICKAMPRHRLQELWTGSGDRITTFLRAGFNTALNSCLAYTNARAHRKACSTIPASDDM
jgi:hypothetical protein